MSTKNAPTPLAYYIGLSLKQLVSEFQKQFCMPLHKGINRAKCIVAMERKKDAKQSLTSFMKEQFGVVDSNAFKPARVFRDLVAMDNEGNTLPTAGAGEITEADFDRILAITVHIAASAILGVIEKQFEDNPEGAAPWKEKLADVLRNHQNTEDTLKALEVIKVQLKPAKDKKKDGAAEGEDSEEKSADASIPATPADVLRHVANPVFWEKLLTGCKNDPESAVAVASLIQAVADAATGALPIVMDFATKAPAQAAA